MVSYLKNNRLLNLFLIFIIFQPIIDALTTFSIVTLESSATFGMFIRVLYMGLGVLFILMNIKNSKLAKSFFIYLVILGATILLNLVINYFIKSPFYIGQEVKFFIKVSYLNIVFLNFILVFKMLKDQGKNIYLKSIKFILYSALIIGSIMVVSIVTSTSLESYTYSKIGFTGWFFAGNEIGAIIAIITPLVALHAIRATESYKDIYKWIPFLLVAFSLLMLGTKVGYGALLIVLLISAFICGFLIWKSKNKTNKSKYIKSFSISTLLLVVLLVLTPFTPVFTNTYTHIEFLGIDLNSDDNDTKSQDDNDTANDKDSENKDNEQINKKQLQNLILSSREDYLAKHREDYISSPIPQKIFGLGFAGNYETEEPKMIEMDFYDLFFSFGILGFSIFIAPLVYFVVKSAIKIIKNIKEYFTPKYVLMLASIALTLGIAYFAGHVFTAPAVSIYFAFIFALLIVEIDESEETID
jgi:hypothetical protein